MPEAPPGVTMLHSRVTISGSRSGWKVDSTRARSVRLIMPPVPVWQKPLNTSSNGRPERPTAFRTRRITLSASGKTWRLPFCWYIWPSCMLDGLRSSISAAMARSSTSTVSRSLEPESRANRSMSSEMLVDRPLKDESPATKSSRVMRPCPMDRSSKKSGNVSPWASRRRWMACTSAGSLSSRLPGLLLPLLLLAVLLCRRREKLLERDPLLDRSSSIVLCIIWDCRRRRRLIQTSAQAAAAP
mmetsp:Transcript_3587/g.8108  ORF Transcript_3587/g.8108 Transcript_3587/m.8108 type:complete len:243 (-) Transcript_3587:139-867(-)